MYLPLDSTAIEATNPKPIIHRFGFFSRYTRMDNLLAAPGMYNSFSYKVVLVALNSTGAFSIICLVNLPRACMLVRCA